MWGGRFGESPDAIMEEINVSIDVDQHLYAQDIAASKAHAAMLAAQGIITANDAKNITGGLDTILSEIGKGSVLVQARARRHSHECRKPPRRTDRTRSGPSAHRALAQRSGCDRFPALRPRRHRRPRQGAGRVSARAGGPRHRACRHRDAGLHPFADRAACDVRPSSAGLHGNGVARPRPFRGCPQAAE